MKEGMSNNSTTSISQARKAVEQLKMEACMDRVKVSSLGMFLPVPEWPCEYQSPNRGTVSWVYACSKALNLPRGSHDAVHT